MRRRPQKIKLIYTYVEGATKEEKEESERRVTRAFAVLFDEIMRRRKQKQR